MKTQIVSALIALSSLVSASAVATGIQIQKFEAVSFTLNEVLFPFNSTDVYFDMTETTATLNIYNVPCPKPKLPGMNACLAMPSPLVIAHFELSAGKADKFCGVVTRESNVVNHLGINHQILIRDFRNANKVDCLIPVNDEIEVELSSVVEGQPEILSSSIQVKEIQRATQYFLDSSKYQGPFFKHNRPDLVTLTIDKKKNEARLYMANNPCGKGDPGHNICLAMPRVIINETFKLEALEQLMHKPFCNETEFKAESVLSNQEFMGGGAGPRYRASLFMKDLTQSTCFPKNQGKIEIELVVEKFSKVGADQILVKESSTAELVFSKE